MKILLVDDDPNILELLEIRLELKGYEVIKASDGIEAMAKAKSERPDLIILDAHMPAMDGYQFLQEQKWQVDIKDIPVLVLTAQVKSRAAFEEVDAVRFVTKPFDSKNLLSVVDECLSSR